MKLEGLTLAEFKRKRLDNVKVDPLNLAYRRSREDIFMNIDLKDVVVGAKGQIALWEA
ncbi:hypothetical protein OAK75_05935 [Bacteriovoracales bacterium]|nr:hypothetical protein [Bacteriovoracales bacterium]